MFLRVYVGLRCIKKKQGRTEKQKNGKTKKAKKAKKAKKQSNRGQQTSKQQKSGEAQKQSKKAGQQIRPNKIILTKNPLSEIWLKIWRIGNSQVKHLGTIGVVEALLHFRKQFHQYMECNSTWLFYIEKLGHWRRDCVSWSRLVVKKNHNETEGGKAWNRLSLRCKRTCTCSGSCEYSYV